MVLDTNVFISGIFFSGPPYEILDAWRNNQITLVISADILEEYRRVGQRLSNQFPGVDIGPILALIVNHGDFVEAPALYGPVCRDPSDDMFFACAVASGASIIISGDKHLLQVNGYHGIAVFSPREFLENYLSR